ncbi:hypothetical protein PR048_013162 [Dryococelus australis]|uniref:Uncharacterized protein n=1 Tax=Dryococelus australis TaxID=614101 RepID=A0ABQ9HRD2_9NEOP|nr:hypothetical protein PR048_013162 [Dryococelus australis]
MYKQVESYIRACNDHQTKKDTNKKPASPFPKTTIGNRYYVMCFDYSTRRAETRTALTGKMQAVAQFMLDTMICRHSTPNKNPIKVEDPPIEGKRNNRRRNSSRTNIGCMLSTSQARRCSSSPPLGRNACHTSSSTSLLYLLLASWVAEVTQTTDESIPVGVVPEHRFSR